MSRWLLELTEGLKLLLHQYAAFHRLFFSIKILLLINMRYFTDSMKRKNVIK